MALLSLATALLSFRLDSYPLILGFGAIAFMGLNALAAVYPLYMAWGRKNPFNVYLAGMAVRLGLIGIALILIVQLGGLTQKALLSLTLTAMISFVAYLVMEIRHFLRSPSGLLGPATPGSK